MSIGLWRYVPSSCPRKKLKSKIRTRASERGQRRGGRAEGRERARAKQAKTAALSLLLKGETHE